MDAKIRTCIERWRVNHLDGDFTASSKETVIDYLLIDLVENAKTYGISEGELQASLGEDLRDWVRREYESV